MPRKKFQCADFGRQSVPRVVIGQGIGLECIRIAADTTNFEDAIISTARNGFELVHPGAAQAFCGRDQAPIHGIRRQLRILHLRFRPTKGPHETALLEALLRRSQIESVRSGREILDA